MNSHWRISPWSGAAVGVVAAVALAWLLRESAQALRSALRSVDNAVGAGALMGAFWLLLAFGVILVATVLVAKWFVSQIPACKSRGHVIAGRTTDGLASAIAITRELMTKTTKFQPLISAVPAAWFLVVFGPVLVGVLGTPDWYPDWVRSYFLETASEAGPLITGVLVGGTVAAYVRRRLTPSHPLGSETQA